MRHHRQHLHQKYNLLYLVQNLDCGVWILHLLLQLFFHLAVCGGQYEGEVLLSLAQDRVSCFTSPALSYQSGCISCLSRGGLSPCPPKSRPLLKTQRTPLNLISRQADADVFSPRYRFYFTAKKIFFYPDKMQFSSGWRLCPFLRHLLKFSLWRDFQTW